MKTVTVTKSPSCKKTLFGDPTVFQQKRLFDMPWDQSDLTMKNDFIKLISPINCKLSVWGSRQIFGKMLLT